LLIAVYTAAPARDTLRKSALAAMRMIKPHGVKSVPAAWSIAIHPVLNVRRIQIPMIANGSIISCPNYLALSSDPIDMHASSRLKGSVLKAMQIEWQKIRFNRSKNKFLTELTEFTEKN
jgi:hypothetical protein